MKFIGGIDYDGHDFAIDIDRIEAFGEWDDNITLVYLKARKKPMRIYLPWVKFNRLVHESLDPKWKDPFEDSE